MTYWLMDGCSDEEEWDKVRSQLELPPEGYTGTLRGTVWDPDAMAASYAEGGGW